MPNTNNQNPGFSFQISKNGDLHILRYDQLITCLRGNKAWQALVKLEGLNTVEQQQLLARLTGNYKRGNEKQARQHQQNNRQ